MFRSLPRTSAAILVVTSLSFAACDELEDDVLVGPSGSRFPTPTVNTLVIPATTLPFQILPVLGCPFAKPFKSHFSVVVNPVDVDLTLNEVGLQFVDTAGIVSPLIFDARDLAVLFGSTAVIAGVSRTFPFETGFGCNFQGTPHLLRGRAVFVSPHGRRVERTFEGRFRDDRRH
jgi:hypothetical protein